MCANVHFSACYRGESNGVCNVQQHAAGDRSYGGTQEGNLGFVI